MLSSRGRLQLECLLIFLAGPIGALLVAHHIGRFLVALLVALGILMVYILRINGDRTHWHLLPVTGVQRELPGILGRLLVGGAILAAGVLLLRPRLFLSFVEERPLAFALICLAYPILSVWPQEIVFRMFFFRRYGPLFRDKASMIACSGLAFGFAHVIFGNWTAPLLSTLGGLMFARTYARSGSLPAAVLEHSLWGILILTVGLGRFFHGAAIGTPL